MEFGKIYMNVSPALIEAQESRFQEVGIKKVMEAPEEGDRPMRDGEDTVCVAFTRLLAAKPAELSRWYERLTKREIDLRVLDYETRFAGITALPTLIEMWQLAVGQKRTEAARAAAAQREGGIKIIKTPEQRKEFRRLWGDTENTVPDLAAVYDVSEATIRRARKQLRLPKRA